jgi:N-acetylglutamate synthase-like GNAT family acetyltransferase
VSRTESKQDDNLEDQMLDALELFHYSFAFRDSLFVVYVEHASALERLFTDLQLIQSAQIFLLVVVKHSEIVKRRIRTLKSEGFLIEYFKHDASEDISAQKQKIIKKEYSSHDVVVFGLNSKSENSELECFSEALEIASLLGPKKFFYVNSTGSLEKDGIPLSHISLKDLNVENSLPTLEEKRGKIVELLEHHSIDIVIIDSSPGALFQEVFTHQGRGTLLTKEYNNEIRRGEPKDVFTVSRLIKPHIERGLILPMTEEELASEIGNFLLYVINGSIVAGAKIINYGDTGELSKFFSLPRFRRRGHARLVATSLIEEAKKMGKKYVFSLSISPGMWDFFQSLGFSEIDRKDLPKEWQEGYDFTRNSKAFILHL